MRDTLARVLLRLPVLSGLVLVALCLRVGLFVADQDAPVHSLELRVQDITSETPGLYTVPVTLPGSWWRRVRGDSVDDPFASTLTLFEDGRALGPAHEAHANIPGGSGRYSHWGDWLYFSTSDGSNPQSNGRAYRIEARLAVEPRLVLGVDLLLAAGVMLIALARTRADLRARRRRFPHESRKAVVVAVATERVLGAPGGSGRRRACAASGLLVALITALAVGVPRQESAVDAQAVQAGSGRLRYVPVEVAFAFPFRIRSDSSNAPKASSLRLYEDGRLLEPAHAEHSVIEAGGAGHYSHWNGFLYFSSSDDTEPASAAHRYTFSVKPALIPGLLPGAWLLFLLLAALARPAVAARVAERLMTPAADLSARACWSIVGLGVMMCCGYVIWNWTLNPGAAPAPSLAGYLPLSDALGYNTCATQAALLGHFMEHYEFCSRRTLYPSLLASFHLLTRSQLELVLLVQAAVVAIVLGFVVMRLARVLSALAALLAGAVLLAYASEYALGLFMTEFTGIVFGLLALSLFLDEQDGAFRSRFVVACALLSVALVSRNGAMFMLPALLAWAVLERWRAGMREVLRLALATAAALAFGLVLQRVILAFNGVDAVSSFNNFATVIYRLSIGAKDWTQALIDYPKLPNEPEAEQFARIYGHALANILAQPMVFLRALGRAFLTYTQTLYHFDGARNFAGLLNGLTALGLIGCAVGWRQRTCRLLLCLAAGEMLSAPLIVEDGGMRVFAASIGLRVVLSAIGLLVLFSLAARAARLPAAMRMVLARPFCAGLTPHGHRHEFVLATTLVALMLLPYADFASAQLRPAPLAGSGCPPGMREMVIDLGHESFAIGLTDGIAPAYSKPLVLTRHRMINGVRSTWYESEIAALPERALVIQAIDRAESRFARAVLLSIDEGGVLLDSPGPVTVCFVPHGGPKVAAYEYRRIEHVGPAAPFAP
jgi:hypothetical protein